MSNPTISITTPFTNVSIEAGQTSTFNVGGTLNQFYCYSVNSPDASVLTITNGWFSDGLSNHGPGCNVTNTGTKTITFNLVLLTVTPGE